MIDKVKAILDMAFSRAGANVHEQENHHRMVARQICVLFEQPKPQDDPRVQPVPVPVALRLLAEWIAIDHDETRLQWEKYLVEAQELADYLHVIGYHRCPKVEWPVLTNEEIGVIVGGCKQWFEIPAKIAQEQRDADWEACHKEEK